MRSIRLIPLILIAIGSVGMCVVSYKRNRLLSAFVVLKWCEVEQIVMKNKTGGPACTAAGESAVPDNLEPLLEFYRKNHDYDPFGERKK